MGFNFVWKQPLQGLEYKKRKQNSNRLNVLFLIFNDKATRTRDLLIYTILTWWELQMQRLVKLECCCWYYVTQCPLSKLGSNCLGFMNAFNWRSLWTLFTHCDDAFHKFFMFSFDLISTFVWYYSDVLPCWTCHVKQKVITQDQSGTIRQSFQVFVHSH